MTEQPSSPQPEDADLKPYFWKFALLLTIMFLLFRVGFKGPDYPIYPISLDSIFSDGELNVVNNLREYEPQKSCAERFRGEEVTETYNYADFHNIGSIILWAPFYLYGKGLAALYCFLVPGNHAPNLDASLTICALSYSTVFMGFFSCLLVFLIAARFFSPRSAFWSTLLTFWGTPAFYYTLIENGNANIPAMFMGVILLLTIPTGLTGKGWRPAFLLGLLFAFCVAVKIDLRFQIFMIIATAFFFWLNGNLRLPNLVFVVLGFLLGEIPRLLNEYIKFGSFHSGEAGLLNLRNYYHLQQLISPYQGFLTTSPILIICLFGLLILIWITIRNSNLRDFLHAPDQASQRILLAMSIWLGAKLFIIGFRFAWGGGTFGARQLLTELPYFVLLLTFLSYRNQSLNNRWFRLILPTTLAIALFVNLVHAGEYLVLEPMSYYLHPPSLLERIYHLRFPAMLFGDNISQLPLKLTSTPLFLLTLWLTWALLSRSRDIVILLAPWEGQTNHLKTEKPPDYIHRWLRGLIVYMLFTWFTISLLNLINNQTIVEAMYEEDCFKYVTIVPPSWFELNENVNSMREMVNYYRLKGDQKEVEHIQSICKLLYPAEFHRLTN